MNIIIGIVIALIGIGMIIKTEWIVQNFGTNAWAEAKLGYNGGSRLLYKFIGLCAIFIGFLFITNLFNGFLVGTVGKVLVPQSAPQQ